MSLLCSLGIHDWKYQHLPPAEEEIPESVKGAPCYSKATCKRCPAIKIEGQFDESDFRSVILPSNSAATDYRIKEIEAKISELKVELKTLREKRELLSTSERRTQE